MIVILINFLARKHDKGQTVKLARHWIFPALQQHKFFATKGITLQAKRIYATWGNQYTIRHPIALAAVSLLGNWPLYLFTWKLALNCRWPGTVVASHLSFTPMDGLLFLNYVGKPVCCRSLKYVWYRSKSGAGNMSIRRIHCHSLPEVPWREKNCHATAAPMFKKRSLDSGGNIDHPFCDSDFEPQFHSIQYSLQIKVDILLGGSRIFCWAITVRKIRAAFVNRTESNWKWAIPWMIQPISGASGFGSAYEKKYWVTLISRKAGGKILAEAGKKIRRPCATWIFYEPTVI